MQSNYMLMGYQGTGSPSQENLLFSRKNDCRQEKTSILTPYRAFADLETSIIEKFRLFYIRNNCFQNV